LRESVRNLWRCRGGEEGPGIAGIQESHDGQRLTGVVHAQFKRPPGMGLELKLQRGPWARVEAASWLEQVCGAAEGRVHGGAEALSDEARQREL
jgi:hypothetical protein